MKLFIQIPCLNEADTLGRVIRDLPREVPGFDEIHTLVIDDGSTDRTLEVAEELGVDHVLRNPYNMGLARSYCRGVDACIGLGADVIVNTDGDNQYCGEDIARLVAPILDGEADIVVGCRDIDHHREFSWAKKFMQRSGSALVQRLSSTSIPDTTSGFRALSRLAATRLLILNSFSYTLEMLIQAGRTGLRAAWVPIRVNPATRPSRLFRSGSHFILSQLKVMLFVFLFYCPMRFFGWLAGLSALLTLAASTRVAYYLWFTPEGVHKFKIGTGLMLLFGLVLTLMLLISGFLGAVLSGLRSLAEDTRFRVRSTSMTEEIAIQRFDIRSAPVLFRWQRKSGPPPAAPRLAVVGDPADS